LQWYVCLYCELFVHTSFVPPSQFVAVNRAHLTKENSVFTRTGTQHVDNLKWLCVCETAIV
jgi:hypothetical protein